MISRAIDLLLYSSLFTAFCAVALCMATERFVNNRLPCLFHPLHLALFGSALLVYNAPRVYRNFRSRVRDVHFYRIYLPTFCTGVLLVACALPFLTWRLVFGGLLLGGITLSYSLPLLPVPGRKRLREYGSVKPLMLAGIWTIATSVLPIVFYAKSPLAYPVEILLRFLLIFALCIVFDIRDVRADQRDQIHTLPQRIGLHNSYRLIHTMLLLFAFFSFYQFSRFHDVEKLAACCITSITASLVVAYLRRHPSERAYMGLGDGVMLVYAVLVLWH